MLARLRRRGRGTGDSRSRSPPGAIASNIGVVPPITSGWPDSGVVFTPSAVTPSLASVLSKVGMMPKMPIEPVIVVGSAKITSPAVDTQ